MNAFKDMFSLRGLVRISNLSVALIPFPGSRASPPGRALVRFEHIYLFHRVLISAATSSRYFHLTCTNTLPLSRHESFPHRRYCEASNFSLLYRFDFEHIYSRPPPSNALHMNVMASSLVSLHAASSSVAANRRCHCLMQVERCHAGTEPAMT